MDKPLKDNDMDPVLVRALSRLGDQSPGRGFEERIMERVALPHPRAVTFWRRARGWALEPRHALQIGAVYAASAIVALIVVVPWLLANSPAIAVTVDWLTARTLGVVRDGALALAQWSVSSGIAGLFGYLPRSGPALWIGALGLAAGYAACAFGLRSLLRTPGRSDAIQIRA